MTGGARLGRDKSPEAGQGPGAHMLLLADGDEVVAVEHYLPDGTQVDAHRLKELRPLADSLRVVD